ncbi:aspartate aminotransferase family protein [Paenibacillus aquistagni]|uniref:aspartate aminotransferase family protein n=1 Tax=Paenibacillus aquistagni TaxID=1852522 RepID=UPI00145AA25F|nr:aspartate aminotransferase family protein [Paenibacillus aquistagni]NMM52504.1 aspartate aminotransferase family protein [Paenibacillus aquistagni]
MTDNNKAYIGPEAIVAKRKQYGYPCTANFYKNPPQIVGGKMHKLYDHEGKSYVDFFTGVSVVACGHCNEAITSKTIEQLQQLQHTSTIYLTQPMVELAERLANGILPGNLKRTFFVNSGSEANEGAMLVARMHTKRRNFLALEYGLHGRTFLTMNVTGIPMWRTDDYLDSDVATFIPRPYDPALDLESAARRSLDALAAVLAEKGDTFAAMIVEPIQGNGGMIVPPDWYFRELKAMLEAHGILLIADEIQTGYGRTGRMFGIEHYGIVPDILTMAKALGNGVPIGAFSTTDEIAASLNRPSASTFGGNPVSAATALAVLDYIEQEGLVERSAQMGGKLIEGLKALQAKHPVIVDVRGKGFMAGAEIQGANDQESAEWTDVILENMKDRGYIIGKNGVGRNVLAFQPAMITPWEEIEAMLNALDEVLGTLSYRE